MNIWLTKNSEVPIREQLTLQITLGIAGGDLSAGERLPSTGEISRRFGVHANTVSAAYRKLVEQKLIEFRNGSGYYVRDAAVEIASRETKAARLLDNVFAELRKLGFTDSEIIERLSRRRIERDQHRVILFEPDNDLRMILEFELREAGFEVEILPSDGSPVNDVGQSILVAMFDERRRIEGNGVIPAKCVYLSGRSVAASIAGHKRPANDDVIGVVSEWEGFLTMARVMLIAVNIEPGNLILRSTATVGWEKAVESADFLICDALTACQLPPGSRGAEIFRLISDESVAEIREALQTS